MAWIARKKRRKKGLRLRFNPKRLCMVAAFVLLVLYLLILLYSSSLSKLTSSASLQSTMQKILQSFHENPYSSYEYYRNISTDLAQRSPNEISPVYTLNHDDPLGARQVAQQINDTASLNVSSLFPCPTPSGGTHFCTQAQKNLPHDTPDINDNSVDEEAAVKILWAPDINNNSESEEAAVLQAPDINNNSESEETAVKILQAPDINNNSESEEAAVKILQASDINNNSEVGEAAFKILRTPDINNNSESEEAAVKILQAPDIINNSESEETAVKILQAPDIINNSESEEASVKILHAPDSNNNSEVEEAAFKILRTPDINNNSGDEESPVEILWTNWRDLELIAESVFAGSRNLLCQVIEDAVEEFHSNKVQSSQLPRIHVTAEVSCFDLCMMSGFGTGNYIQVILMMRMAVKHLSIAHVKLNITCKDTEEVQWDLILPWLSGVWYSPNYFVNALQMPNFAEMQGSPFLSSTLQQLNDSMYCGPVSGHHTYLMYEELKYDLRRMAIALLGLPIVGTDHFLANNVKRFIEQNIIHHGDDVLEKEYPKQSMHLSPGNQQKRISKRMELVPLFSLEEAFDKEVDEATLHFRCGDVMSGNYKGYGFLPFPDYSQHIASNVRSIGILAQPFCQEANITDKSSVLWFRKDDIAYCARCEILSLAFKQFLSEQFPYATVTIRNTPSEPLSVVYARMVLANETVGALSSFSLYPILATFGQGYYLQRGAVKMWRTANPDNFAAFDESKILLGSALKDLWDTEGEDAVLHWFRTVALASNLTEEAYG